jgi:hypothetical protein
MVKIGKEDLKNSSNLSGFRTSSHMAPSLKGRAIFASSPCQLNKSPVYPQECDLLFIIFVRTRSGNRLFRQLLMCQGLIQLLMRQGLIKSRQRRTRPIQKY